MPSKPRIIRHMSDELLRETYRREQDGHVKTRLLAVIHLYEGKSTPDVAETVGASPRSIRRWAKIWNEGGYENLKPRFSGGPKPLLGPEQWEKVVAYTENRGMDIKDVRRHIAEEYGVEYSYSGVWKQIRGKYRVPYGKPLKK